jgi:hypothetical protein
MEMNMQGQNSLHLRSSMGLGLLAVLLSCTCGCGVSVLNVVRTKPMDPPVHSLDQCVKGNACVLPGIPFYAVGYQCLHSTVWLQPVYSVSVVVTSSNGDYVTSATKYLGRLEFDDSGTQNVLNAVKAASQASTGVADYKAILDEFTKLPDVDPVTFDTTKITDANSDESQEVMLASNTVAPERFVDTRSIYFYNVNKPITGPASAEIDLSNEGILSKASGQVEDKTLPTILSALPISDLIKAGVAVAYVRPGPPQPAGAGKYKLDLQIQTRIYKHTRSQAEPGATIPCSPTPMLVGADGSKDYNFTVEDVTTPPQSAPSKPNPSTNKPADGGSSN